MSVAQEYAQRSPGEPTTDTAEISPRSAWQHPRPAVLTRSETVECSCPDHCERDHEQD